LTREQADIACPLNITSVDIKPICRSRRRIDERQSAGRMSERSEFSSCRLSSVRLREPVGQGIGCVSLLTFFRTSKESKTPAGRNRQYELLASVSKEMRPLKSCNGRYPTVFDLLFLKFCTQKQAGQQIVNPLP
jgi:hypothetical protein